MFKVKELCQTCQLLFQKLFVSHDPHFMLIFIVLNDTKFILCTLFKQYIIIVTNQLQIQVYHMVKIKPQCQYYQLLLEPF